MTGEWAVATGDPPKESAAKHLDTSSTMWNFVGGWKHPGRVMEDFRVAPSLRWLMARACPCSGCSTCSSHPAW